MGVDIVLMGAQLAAIVFLTSCHFLRKNPKYAGYYNSVLDWAIW